MADPMEEESEDEVPLTALVKREPRAAAEEDDGPPRRGGGRKRNPSIVEDSDSEAEFNEDAPPPPPSSSRASSGRPTTNSKARTAGKRKPPPPPDSDSESEEFDSDSEEEFEDEEEAPKPKAKPPAKKKPRVELEAEPKKRASSSSSSSSSSSKAAAAAKKRKPSSNGSSGGGRAGGGGRVKSEPGSARQFKELKKMEKLEQAMKSFKWWEHEDLPQGVQWRSMEHNGLSFPPAYTPHGVPLLYKGDPVELTPELEELATFYAAMPEDGPQLGDPATAPTFKKNFFDDFKKALGKKHVVQEFKHCDFSRIKQHVEQEKIIKKAATVDEKASAKQEKDRALFFYGFALVDNHLERVGNIMLEPPGLFRGRGKHPLTGKVKHRQDAESVTINVAESVKPPKCPTPGHAWGGVKHDPGVTWLATWHENILGNNKYVMLAAQSSFKGKSDRSKYEKAMRLKGCIDKIRADYRRNLSSKDSFKCQLATAMWVIDILALRVGGEKGEDEADTVGCCSLRLEHVHMGGEDQGEYDIELEFLGKDSMVYKATTDFSQYGDVGRQVYRNFARFVGKKRKLGAGASAQQLQVFDELDPPQLNKHLQTLMPGLTAKVFRTYNASETLQNELPSNESMADMTVAEKVLAYNDANRKVAILCNHQRTVSKAVQSGLDGLGEKLELLKRQKQELRHMLKLVKGDKTGKLRLKGEVSEAAEDAKRAIDEAKQMTEDAKTPEAKIAATRAMDAARQKQREARGSAQEQMHLFARQPSVDQVERRVEQWTDKIRKLEIDLRNKDENKEVALGTSKINYCDPRISVAWCKRCEVPIERIFPRTLRDKFVWSMPVEPNWLFNAMR